MDAIDEKIIAHLSLDARATITDIANNVGRSRIAVQNRINALTASGEITGFSVNLKRLPLSALLEVRLNPKCKCEDIVHKIKAKFRINKAWSVAGGTDLFIWTEAEHGETLQDMRSYIMGLNEVHGASTHIVIKTYE